MKIIQYNSFKLDFDKVTNENINKAVSKLFGLSDKVSENWVQWNILGNYIMWFDGGHHCFYFCRNYIKIKGIDIFYKEDVEECLNYLKQYRQTSPDKVEGNK